jgi:putative transposase
MAHSLSQVFIHLNFSTDCRRLYLDKEIRDRVFPYIAGILKNLQASVLKIGGADEHIHILFRLPKDISLMQIIMKVKSNSSRFIKGLDGNHDSFAWQSGYYAVGVPPSALENVKRYIGNQEQHHMTESYRAEVMRRLREDNVDFDEEKLWD